MELKTWFIKSYKNKEILFASSGRSALQAAIKDFSLKNSKIIIPSFICADVFYSLFKTNNIAHVFIDCPKKSFNLSFSNIKEACEKNKGIKAIILVHNFGLLNKDIEKIALFCKKKNIILIEDCAHIINISKNNKQAGCFGDASIFSFPKISNAFLGGAYVRNKGKINVKAEDYKVRFIDIYRFFNMNFRFIIDFLKLFKKEKQEKLIIKAEKIIITKPPFFFSLFKIKNDFDTEKRKKIALIFHKKLNSYLLEKTTKENFFQSIPILVKNRDKIFQILTNKGIKCRKFWHPILSSLYNKKSPNADFFSERILNILINPSWDEKQAEKISDTISKTIKKYDF